MPRLWLEPLRTNRTLSTTWHGRSCIDVWLRTQTTTIYKVSCFMLLALILHSVNDVFVFTSWCLEPSLLSLFLNRVSTTPGTLRNTGNLLKFKWCSLKIFMISKVIFVQFWFLCVLLILFTVQRWSFNKLAGWMAQWWALVGAHHHVLI